MDIYNKTLLAIDQAPDEASKLKQMQEIFRIYKNGEFSDLSTYSLSWLVNLATQKVLLVLKKLEDKKTALKIIEEFSTILVKHNIHALFRIVLENEYDTRDIRNLWKASQINPDLCFNQEDPVYVEIEEIVYAQDDQEELLELIFCTSNEESQEYLWQKFCLQEISLDLWKKIRKSEWVNGVSYNLFVLINKSLPENSTRYENLRIILHLSSMLHSADIAILEDLTNQIKEILTLSDNPKDLSLCIILIQKFLEPYEIADELLEQICKILEQTDFRGEVNKIEFFTEMEEASIFIHLNNLDYELTQEKGKSLKNCYEGIIEFEDKILNESVESALNDPLLKLYFKYKDSIGTLEAEDEFLNTMKGLMVKKSNENE